MAGIVWWTAPRKSMLRWCIETEGLTYAQAAAWLSRKYHRRVTARACRDQGQAMKLRTSTVRGDARKKVQP